MEAYQSRVSTLELHRNIVIFNRITSCTSTSQKPTLNVFKSKLNGYRPLATYVFRIGYNYAYINCWLPPGFCAPSISLFPKASSNSKNAVLLGLSSQRSPEGHITAGNECTHSAKESCILSASSSFPLLRSPKVCMSSQQVKYLSLPADLQTCCDQPHASKKYFSQYIMKYCLYSN